MVELIDINPAVDVPESEYARLLGYPPSHVLEGRPLELAHWARAWYRAHGHPWMYARQADAVDLGDATITIDGTSFTSEHVRKQFREAGVTGAFLAAVSAGNECETMSRKLWLEEKPDEYFFLEMFGSAVVERLITQLGFRFCEWAEQHQSAILPHYSPGYPGWNIAEQGRLLNLIQRNGKGSLPAALEVFDTGMLNPKKSLLALFGITPHVGRVLRLDTLIPCQNCSLSVCQYRRAPYRRPMPRTERVEQSLLESGNGSLQPARAEQPYSVSLSALRKWSEERLSLKPLANGSTEALFRYNGTTCSNLGRPLEFLYRVTVGPPERGHIIEHATCAPSTTDEGHRSMCEYIKRGSSLTEEIAGEHPLVGHALHDVFTWERSANPSACFCETPGREHKWGLVYEVLHYALNHRPAPRDAMPVSMHETKK